MDMTEDIFATQPYGRLALLKMAPYPENFRLYSAGWLEEKPNDFNTMKVTGAEFRVAKSGPNRGKLSILVKGTIRTVYITREEINKSV